MKGAGFPKTIKQVVAILFLAISTFLASAIAAEQPTVVINSANIDLPKFPMSYFIDDSENMPFTEVINQTFTSSSSMLTLGTNAMVTWSKIHVVNRHGETTRLFVHHPYAYHLKSVSFYETQHQQLLNHTDIPLYQGGDKPLMYGGTAVFSFELAPNEAKTIYVKNISFSHQWYQLSIFDEEASKKALVSNGNYIALLVGMMLALMIYNFFLYISAHKIENVVYAFYLISGTIWVSLSYGVAANFFGVFSAEVFQFNSTLLSMPSFLVLFMMLIFDTRNKYPKEHIALSAILLMLVGDFIYSLFDITAALKPASTLAAIMMVVTFAVSISLWRKREPLAKYFFLGHFMFIAFNMSAVFYYKGLSEFNQINSHGVGIGILLEALMMAFVLSYRINELERIKGKQEELKRLADTDPMTGLYNRRYFEIAAKQAIEQAKRSQTNISLMVLDIDHFKSINDNHGHLVGDDIIVAFADLLKQHQRNVDIVCRFGGEEFLLLLPECDADNANKVAERIRMATSNISMLSEDKVEVNFTVSIGVHQLSLSKDNIKQAIDAADRALYIAKSSGRNRVIVTESETIAVA